MQNVQLSVKGDKLVVTIDLSVSGEPSRSGKSSVLASTKGNVPIPGRTDLRLGINLYKQA